MGAIINEHLRKADESVEVVELQDGNIWSFQTDGEVILFRTMHDLVMYVYFGEPTVQRKYCREDDLFHYYEEARGWDDIDLTIVE